MLFTHCWGLYTSELSEYVILVNSTCHMSGEFYKWCHIWVQQSLKMKSMASLALGGNLLWLVFHLDVWIEYNSWKIRNANNVYRRRTNLAAVLQLNIFEGGGGGGIALCLRHGFNSSCFLAYSIYLEHIKHVWYFELILELILFSCVSKQWGAYFCMSLKSVSVRSSVVSTQSHQVYE